MYRTYGLRCEISKTKLYIKAPNSYRKYGGLVGGYGKRGQNFDILDITHFIPSQMHEKYLSFSGSKEFYKFAFMLLSSNLE